MTTTRSAPRDLSMLQATRKATPRGYLSIPEAAVCLGLAPMAVYHLIRRGALPVRYEERQASRRWYVPEAAVVAEARRLAAQQEAMDRAAAPLEDLLEHWLRGRVSQPAARPAKQDVDSETSSEPSGHA